MLAYIIDGFNLIYRVPKLKRSITPHSDLINYLKKNKLTGSRNNKVIIVFDGKIDPEVLSQESTFKIYFSGAGSADSLIKDLINKFKNKSEVLVISDDRQIRYFTKNKGARSIRIAEFIAKTKKPIKEDPKDISYTLKREITEELRKIWLRE